MVIVAYTKANHVTMSIKLNTLQIVWYHISFDIRVPSYTIQPNAMNKFFQSQF